MKRFSLVIIKYRCISIYQVSWVTCATLLLPRQRRFVGTRRSREKTFDVPLERFARDPKLWEDLCSPRREALTTGRS